MIEYRPTDADMLCHRDEVIRRAVKLAAAASETVAMILKDGSKVLVLRSHAEQVRAELNRVLPTGDQQ